MFLLSGLLTALTLILAISQHPPANIARYLWCVLAEIPFLWVVHSWYGDESYIYVCTYLLFTTLILLAICRIAINSLKGRKYRLRAIAITFLLALVPLKLALLDMHGQWAWVSVSEGFVLCWAGSLTMFSGAYRPIWDLYVPLGAFWCLQSLYCFGWSIKWQEWAELNWVLPPLMAIGCFSWLAYRLRAVPREA